jgi:hypothetical protein
LTSFPACIPFLSFSFFIALANSLNTMLNKRKESEPLSHSLF